MKIKYHGLFTDENIKIMNKNVISILRSVMMNDGGTVGVHG